MCLAILWLCLPWCPICVAAVHWSCLLNKNRFGAKRHNDFWMGLLSTSNTTHFFLENINTAFVFYVCIASFISLWHKVQKVTKLRGKVRGKRKHGCYGKSLLVKKRREKEKQANKPIYGFEADKEIFTSISQKKLGREPPRQFISAVPKRMILTMLKVKKKFCYQPTFLFASIYIYPPSQNISNV